MLIEKLQLLNWKSYHDAEIHFTAGCNALIGHNGSGKSSLREAVGFALFGWQAGKLSDNLREGARTGSVIVSLISSLDAQPYQVERRFTATATTRYAVYDDDRHTLAQGLCDVEEWIRQHLKIPTDTDLGTLFENVVAVPQGMFTAAFLLARTHRKDIFDRVLDVDSYKTASDNLRPAVRMLNEQAGTHRTEMARLEGMLSGLAGLKQEKSQLLGDIETLADEIATDRQSLTFAEEQLKLLNEAQAVEKEAEQAVTQAQTRFDAHEYLVKTTRASFMGACYARDRLKDNLAAHTAYLDADSRLQDLDASRQVRDDLLQAQRHARADLAGLATAKERLPEFQRRVELTGQRSAEIEAEVVEASHLQEAIDATRLQLQEKRELADRLQLSQAELQAELTQTTRQRRFLADEAVAACPTCGSPLTAELRSELLQRTSEVLETFRPKHAAVAKQIIRVSHEISALQRHEGETQHKLRGLASQRDLIRARANLKAREEELAKLQERIAGAADAERVAQGFDAALAPYADLNNQLSRFQHQRREHQAAHETYMSNLTLAGELNKLQDAHSAVQRKRAELEQAFTEAGAAYELASKGYSAQMHANVERETRKLHTSLAASEAQLTLKRERLTVVQKSLLYLETAQAELDKVTTELQDTEETHATIQWGRELLREAGPLVTRRLVRQISQEASSVYADLVGNSVRRLEWSDDYALSLTGRGYSRSFRQLSGGERMAAALALRWALSRATSGVGIAFYDEPTANLDPLRRQAIAAIIGKLKGPKQIWVMSHDDTFEAEADNCVRIEWDEAGSHLAL